MRDERPVLIALDGSLRSNRTLGWGVDEAQRREAPVVLARAYRDVVEYAWGWNTLVGDPEKLIETKEYLDTQADVVRTRWPGVAVSSRPLNGFPVPVLRDESATAQLLVVGVGGRDDGHRIGSVAAHLAAHGRCPVAVVRPVPHVPLPEDSADPRSTRPVVVGVDGSRQSIEAAHVAAAAAVSREVPLELVHAHPTVADPLGVIVPPLSTSDEADPARHAALRMADALRAEHPGLELTTTLVDDDPTRALAEASHHAQLLVVGSRGVGAFRGMLIGAVSAHVVRAAACTVLVVRGADDVDVR